MQILNFLTIHMFGKCKKLLTKGGGEEGQANDDNYWQGGVRGCSQIMAAIPPSPLHQQMSAFSWPPPPPPFVSQCMHLLNPLPFCHVSFVIIFNTTLSLDDIFFWRELNSLRIFFKEDLHFISFLLDNTFCKLAQATKGLLSWHTIRGGGVSFFFF